jgi:RND family efflux transporter MFP subunit
MRVKPSIILWTVLGAALSGCTRHEAAAVQDTKPKMPVVKAFHLKSSQPERRLELPGELSAYESVDVYPKVDGFLETVLVDKGDRVRRGQLLARIVAPEVDARLGEAEAKALAAHAQYVEAQAKLQADESSYTRLKAAARIPGVVTENDLSVAKGTVDASRAHVDALRSAEAGARASVSSLKSVHRYLQVTAPFDGIVTARFLHPGALVGPAGAGATKPILHLEDNARLRLTVSVPESEVAGIVPGKAVRFAVSALPDRGFEAVIARVSHALDVKTRSESVELEVPNRPGELASGMYADVTWVVRRSRPSFFVPPSAIVSTTERTFVERLRDGTLSWVGIRRGASTGDRIEVFGDLRENDLIALKGTDELADGTRVAERVGSP